MPLNQLTEIDLKGVDRVFSWLLIIFGYVISLGMALDSAGWDDPVFGVVRKVPYTPYSWAALLWIGVTVYALGEVVKPQRSWRGKVIIFGATLCFLWCAAMAIAMARMVYVYPNRITDLWPLVMSFVAIAYASRIVTYSNIFNGSRWNTNPYQLWNTLFLMIVSMSQMIIGVAPTSVFTEVERPAAFQVASVNFLGAAVVMFGLHLKDQEMGINLEFAGAISLVATLVWYCVLVAQRENLAGTTLGFGLVEAFVMGTVHRSIQILTLKWARWRGKPILEQRLEQAIHSRVVVEEHPSDSVRDS